MSIGKVLLLAAAALVAAVSAALIHRIQVEVIPATDGSEYCLNRLTGKVAVLEAHHRRRCQ
ncbi:MAG: hypothetical protein Q7V53_01265 [Caldisericota bacterium]|jgi:hypothetical protein|nr:hypothetical protein [Caldisericota bacterium]